MSLVMYLYVNGTLRICECDIFLLSGYLFYSICRFSYICENIY